MKKFIAGLAAVIAITFMSMGGASAESLIGDGYGRSYSDGGIVRVDYSCRHLRHECHEERERGYEGRACHVYEDECGSGHCERLRHACHEEREGNDHYGSCHRLHEECEER
jgi:hypothetical protein